MRDLLSKRSENRATYEAIIFDLDGTIVDSNELHVAAWDEAFRHFGKHFSIDELRRQIGKGSDQYLPEFLSPVQQVVFAKSPKLFLQHSGSSGFLPDKLQ